MLYGNEIWCLGQDEIGILQRTERAMVRNMCGVKLVDKKSTKDQMQMLDLCKTIDQLAKANSVRWYGHVLRKVRQKHSENGIRFYSQRDKENG